MTSTTPSAPFSAPVRPRLARSRTDRLIAGVAGGLAAHTGVDAVLWRVALVALTLAGGCGVLLYGLLWLLMPPADALA
jgi:phage shock protein C